MQCRPAGCTEARASIGKTVKCNTSWASKGGGCGRKLQVRLEARWMTGTPYKWEEEGRVKVLYCECLTSSFKE